MNPKSFFLSLKKAIKKNITKDNLLIIVALSFVVAAMYISHIGCPIKYMTGVSCPGCGMTRAVFSAIHLDFHKAFSYHPMWWSLPVLVFTWLFMEADLITKRTFRVILGLFLIMFILVYAYRMYDGTDTIVTAAPHNGLIAKIKDWLTF